MIKYYSHRGKDLQDALAYVPCEVKRKLNACEKPILIYTTHDRFGYSSAPTTVPYVIVVNDTIFPNGHTREDRMYRFFVFTVLHEVAHVYMDMTGTPIEDQEESQADKLAVDWYNDRADRLGFDRLSYEQEIKISQKLVEKTMRDITKTFASPLNGSTECCEEASNAQQAPATCRAAES